MWDACAGQTHSGTRADHDGGLGAFDESAKQLELPNLHLDGENEREVWKDPQSGEIINQPVSTLLFIFLFQDLQITFYL